MKVRLDLTDKSVYLSEKTNAENPPPPPPSSSEYYVRVLHRHDIDELGRSQLEIEGGWKVYPPNQPSGVMGIPSVIKMKTDRKGYAGFKKDWQIFSFELLKRRVKQQNPNAPIASIEAVARKLFSTAYTGDRFQCNKAGTDDGYNDYINGNITGEDIKLEPIILGGNVMKVVGSSKNVYGEECLPVKVFNSSNPAPDASIYNFENTPEMVFLGTIETRIMKDNNPRDRIVRSFEFINQSYSGIEKKSTTAIPYFILVDGSDIAWIAKNRIKVISEDEAKNNNPFI